MSEIQELLKWQEEQAKKAHRRAIWLVVINAFITTLASAVTCIGVFAAVIAGGSYLSSAVSVSSQPVGASAAQYAPPPVAAYPSAQVPLYAPPATPYYPTAQSPQYATPASEAPASYPSPPSSYGPPTYSSSPTAGPPTYAPSSPDDGATLRPLESDEPSTPLQGVPTDDAPAPSANPSEEKAATDED